MEVNARKGVREMPQMDNRRWMHFAAIVLMVALLCVGTGFAQEKTRITFATRSGGFDVTGVDMRRELAEALIAAFERDNPDIEVEWLGIADGYHDKIATMFAAGDSPDVFEVWGTNGMNWAESGMLLDLEPYVRRDLSAEDIDDFFPMVWEAPIIRHGSMAGMRFGIPRYVNVNITWYNKSMFDNAGLIYLDELDRAGAWNWDSLLEYSRKLTTKLPDETYATYGFKADGTVRGAPAFAWASGGGIFDFPANPTEFIMDKPESLAGLEFLYDLRWTHDVWPQSTPGFETGTVGIDQTISTDSIRAAVLLLGGVFDWDVVENPMGPVERGTRTALDLYVLSKQSANPDAAWRFAQFLLSPEAQYLHMHWMGLVPIRRSLYGEFVASYPDYNLDAFFQAAMTARVDPRTVMVQPDRASSLVNQALNASMQLNEKPIRLAVEEIAPAIRALYAE